VILSLDTNVLIEVVRNKTQIVRDRFFEALASERRMIASLVVVHELHVGCELHPNPSAELARVRFALSQVEIEAFDEADMVATAKLAADLIRRGRKIGPFDLLIAGQALARGWTVVTANTREFARIEGLNVIDWTAPAD
jgi:tRNA(fMet)-specific endonuclease VapC